MRLKIFLLICMFLIVCLGFSRHAYSMENWDTSTGSTIEATDDYGNDTGSAALIKINEPVPGSIESPRDIDYFKIEIDRHVIIEVYSTGSTDTFGELLSGDGKPVTSDDDSGELKNFKFQKEVYPGIYYISVRHYYDEKIGEYVLNTKTTDFVEDDYSDTREGAFEIQFSQKIDGNIQGPGDIDYFKINTDKKGIIEIFTLGDTDTFGVLEDAQGNTAAQDDDSGELKNFSISYSASPGTYYIKVRHYYSERYGKYELYANFNELTDDYGNDMSGAFEMNMDEPTPGSIQYGKDIDFFKFVIDETCLFEALSEGTTDTYGTIYNANGQVLAEDDDSGTDKNFQTAVQAEPGVYFLSVRHYYPDRTGQYAISVIKKAIQKDDYGDSFEDASVIEDGAQIACGIQMPGDIDFFKFTALKDCKLDLHTTGSTDTFGILYGEGGTMVAQDDDGGVDKNFMIACELHPGTYYIGVKDYYANLTGDYNLCLKFTGIEAARDYLVVGLDTGDKNTCAFEYDGYRYAYLGCNISPARIVKFDLLEMKRVSSIDLPAGESRDQCRVSALIAISPDTVIHASYTNPCVFTKIDTNTMLVTGTLVGEVEDVNDKYIRAMVYDGKYVYAATESIPGKIIKFDPETMTRVDSCTFSENQASSIFALTIVGDYIVGVCGRDSDEYSRIFRIRKDNLHGTVDSLYISGVSNYHSICSDGRYIYAATYSNPISVVKVDALAQLMVTASKYTGIEYVESGNYSITYDGRNIIVGTWNSYGADKLIKINPDNMAKISSIDFRPSYPADLVYVEPYIYTCCDNATGNVVRLIFN